MKLIPSNDFSAPEGRLFLLEQEAGDWSQCALCSGKTRRVSTPAEIADDHTAALLIEKQVAQEAATYEKLCVQYVVWKKDSKGTQRPTTKDAYGTTVYFDPAKFLAPDYPRTPFRQPRDKMYQWKTLAGQTYNVCSGCLEMGADGGHSAEIVGCSCCSAKEMRAWLHRVRGAAYVTTGELEPVCSPCYGKVVTTCYRCGEGCLTSAATSLETSSRMKIALCPDCSVRHAFQCGGGCGQMRYTADLRGGVVYARKPVEGDAPVVPCSCGGWENTRDIRTFAEMHDADCPAGRAARTSVPVMYGEYAVVLYRVCGSCHETSRNAILPACPDCRGYHPPQDDNVEFPCGYAPHLGDWRIGRGRHHDPTRFFMTKAEERNDQTRPELFIGFELEVEAQDGDTRESHTKRIRAPWLVFKEDGTLNNGIEIVSNPLSWEWIKENSEEIVKRLRLLAQHGCRSFNTQTCGMHVHMSKDAFGSLHLYKYMRLLHFNVEQMTALSQRRKEHLDQFAGLTSEPVERLSLKAKNRKGNQMTDKTLREGMQRFPRCYRTRYVAFNMENEHTVELRLCKGTLHPAGFLKNIEFCVAAYEYTRQCSVPDSSDWQKFCKFVQENVREYPHLAVFVADMSTLRDDTEAVAPSVPKTQAPVRRRQPRTEPGRPPRRSRHPALRPEEVMEIRENTARMRQEVDGVAYTFDRVVVPADDQQFAREILGVAMPALPQEEAAVQARPRR